MEKKCPHCGAELPEEASFCPHCAKSVNSREESRPPRRIPVKVLYACLLLFAAALAFFVYNRPRTYDGMGEVIYRGSGGSYQLLISTQKDRYTPMAAIETEAGDEEFYRIPSWLYINRRDTGEDAKDDFMENMESAAVHIEQPEDSESPVLCSVPEPKEFNTDAALASLIDFTRESPAQSQIVWTLSMKNGDTIVLRSDLAITPTKVYNYSVENADLSGSAALQALIDQIAGETEAKDVVNISLPAVTYEDPIVLRGCTINLTGTEENGKRTTFAAGLRLSTDPELICYLTDLDFSGTGDGVAVSAAGRVWTQNCRFTGWATALLGYGKVWINTTDCTFENNRIGLHYNATDVSPSDSHFTGNVFTDNGTAVLLENVPTDIVMNFGDCVFSGNETDIDNRCGQELELAGAVFEE